MIESPHAQGSPEWFQAHLGNISASEFDKIVTPAKLQLSASRHKYMCVKLAEWISGWPGGIEEPDGVSFMKSVVRGKQMESEAFAAFQLLTGLEARTCGYCAKDESERIIASPDFLLVNGRGGGELKCPELPTFLSYVLMGDKAADEYKMQVQGQIWTCELQDWYFSAYYPGLPMHVVKVARDEACMKAFDEHLPAFIREMDETWARFETMGYRRAA